MTKRQKSYSPWCYPSYWMSFPYRTRWAGQWCNLHAWVSRSMFRRPLLFPAVCVFLGALVGLLAVKVWWNPDVSSPASRPAPGVNVVTVSDKETMRRLSIQLSNLQARADRLDSVGKALVDEVGLENAGFNFGQDPAQGGGDHEMDAAPLNVSSLYGDTYVLAKQYDQLEAQLQILDRYNDLNTKLPVTVPHFSPGGGYQTSGFGARYDPFGRGRKFHAGVDLSAKVGDPVMAMAAGKVVYSGWRGGYGNVVEVDHQNGYRTRYAHNSKLIAKLGDSVEIGQVLARAGSTGRSTGAHLHVEVWRGNHPVDPRPFIEKGRHLLLEKRRVLAQLALVPHVDA